MISDVYFPRVNGVSTSILTFRQELQARGHQVTLLAPAYPQGAEGDDAEVVRLPAHYLVFDPEDRLMRPTALRRWARQVAPESYDLIHIQTPFLAHNYGLRLARRLGVPAVETYHTFFEAYLAHYLPVLPTPLARAIARTISRRQCNRVDRLVVPSSAMLEALRGYGVDTPAAVIPTGIELSAFESGDGARFRRRFGIDDATPLLLYVGRVAHEKNIGFLLEVVARVRRRRPDVQLLIAGEGPAAGDLKRSVRALGLEANVRFVGYLSRYGELQDCYCASDLFVFASRTETQGLVLLEAMALGVPVVSTAVMGTRDVLRDGEGAVVAPEEPDAFAAAVASLLDGPSRRRALAEAARRYAGGWAAGVLAEKMIDFYRETTAARVGAKTVVAPASSR